MDVRLSSEQQALRDSVAAAVERMGPHAVADLDDADRVGRLEAAVASAGWRELRTAGDGPAPLASGVETAIVAEELGRGLADVAFLGPTLAADCRRLAGAEPVEELETVAFTTDLSTVAVAAGDLPPAVAVDTDGARRALALVGGTEGRRLVELPPGRPVPPLDLTRGTWSTEAGIEAALITPADVLGDDALTRWIALGLALTCADLVGVMRGALSLARDYATQRQQYGAPIGSFQAVQHLLADAHVAMEGSRSAALHAAWAVDALDASDARAAGAVAKAYCARAARDVCEAVIQVHGGIGNTWDCLAHVYLRRALLSTDLFGGVGPSLGHVLAHQGVGAA